MFQVSEEKEPECVSFLTRFYVGCSLNQSHPSMQQGPATGAKFMSQRGKPMQERRVGGWQAVQAVQGTPHGQGYPQQHQEEPSGRPIPSLVGGPSKVPLPTLLKSALKCFQFRIQTFPLPPLPSSPLPTSLVFLPGYSNSLINTMCANMILSALLQHFPFGLHLKWLFMVFHTFLEEVFCEI